ncbi:hypothetical protein BV898_18997 [Hypsibius exemplaris]|uniref:Uncharacterized protein n=1 Tax=Hypsibius exemplaris TaxID=2072580 RepID=A0A9X6NI90_HYPEX|nr:hypothetical protein BV898_18997 [Hypsibius exemplaris]
MVRLCSIQSAVLKRNVTERESFMLYGFCIFTPCRYGYMEIRALTFEETLLNALISLSLAVSDDSTTAGDKPGEARETVHVSHDHLVATFVITEDRTAEGIDNFHEKSDNSFLDLFGELSAVMQTSALENGERSQTKPEEVPLTEVEVSDMTTERPYGLNIIP